MTVASLLKPHGYHWASVKRIPCVASRSKCGVRRAELGIVALRLGPAHVVEGDENNVGLRRVNDTSRQQEEGERGGLKGSRASNQNMRKQPKGSET
jgi:hypothetical protein